MVLKCHKLTASFLTRLEKGLSCGLKDPNRLPIKVVQQLGGENGILNLAEAAGVVFLCLFQMMVPISWSVCANDLDGHATRAEKRTQSQDQPATLTSEILNLLLELQTQTHQQKAMALLFHMHPL